MNLDLATLINYEAQIARDKSEEPENLRSRDKKLAERMKLASQNKLTALMAWLKELMFSPGPWPGEKIARGYDLCTTISFIFGLVSGFGMIKALLIYDGSEPVNVFPFIAIYGILQIILLIWYFGKALSARYLQVIVGNSLFALVKSGLIKLTHDGLRQRLLDVHKKLLALHAWKVFQVFGLAFHLASLATLLLMISFNDYTFAWRTTLRIDALAFFDLVSALSLPFAWMDSGLSPSLELIQASQFDRYKKDFLGAPGQGLASVGWWPFLASLILLYGVLPRLLIWIQLKTSIRSYLRLWAFDDQSSEALWRRLQSFDAAWNHSEIEKLREIPEQSLLTSVQGARQVFVVFWRDVNVEIEGFQSFLANEHSLSMVGHKKANGLTRDAEEILESLGKDKVLLVVSDPFELPGEAIDKIRLTIREKFPTLPILFAPVSEASGNFRLSGDLKAWRHALQIYRDPYLGLLDENLT